MACRLAAVTLTRPLRRHLLQQLIPKQCRYCCYPHIQFHTSRHIFQEDKKLKQTSTQTIKEVKDKNAGKSFGTNPKTLSNRLKQPQEGTHSLTIPSITYKALQFYKVQQSKKLNFKFLGKSKGMLITGSKEDLMEFQDEVTSKLNGLFQFSLPLNDFHCFKIEIDKLGKRHKFHFIQQDGEAYIFKKSLKSCEELVGTMKTILKDKDIAYPDKIDVGRVIPDTFGQKSASEQVKKSQTSKAAMQDPGSITAAISSVSSKDIIVHKRTDIPDGSAIVSAVFKTVMKHIKTKVEQEYAVGINVKNLLEANTGKKVCFLCVTGPEENVKKCKQHLKEIHDLSTFKVNLTPDLTKRLFDPKNETTKRLQDQYNIGVFKLAISGVLLVGTEKSVSSYYEDLKPHIEEAKKLTKNKKPLYLYEAPRKAFSNPLVFDVKVKDLSGLDNKSGDVIEESNRIPGRKSVEYSETSVASKIDSEKSFKGDDKKKSLLQKQGLIHSAQRLDNVKQKLRDNEPILDSEDRTQRLENVETMVDKAEQLTVIEDIKDKPHPEDLLSTVHTEIKDEAVNIDTETITETKVSSETQRSDQDRTKVPKPVPVLQSRPPVVTIMGHVDHGKTTLLDALRKSNVVSQEFGGITQHIGAFQVKLKSGNVITFLDTPGHAAFTNMRSRGASMTDIIVLVVAAEDGIMNQTLESIKHAKRAKVPVIVAINKIDLPSAEPEKVKYELANHGMVGEDLGGDVQIVLISALKGTNLDELQENIIAQSELLNLKADNKCMVEATVIESKVDIGRGIQATALIQKGTLKRGSYLIAGTSSAKVRAMLNEHGKPITSAPPGTPVVVTGWDSVPSAGEQIIQVEHEGKLKAILTQREKEAKEELMEASVHQIEERRQQLREDYEMMRNNKKQLDWRQYNRIFMERKGNKVEEGMLKFPVILKADVDGSLEVIMETLNTFYSDHLEMSIVSAEVGNINEGDYELARSTGGRIYGFNVRENEDLSKKYDVPVSVKNVIYDLFNIIQDDIHDSLPTKEVEKEIGRAEVLELFVIKERTGMVNVAGCKCVSGMLRKDCSYRVVRNGETIHEGPLVSMKRLRKDVTSVTEGTECGLGLETGVDVKEGDELICLEKNSEKVELDWDHGVHHIGR